MGGYRILSYVMSPSSASLENEYSYVWKCSPSLWIIMDERVLYGCHNSALSTANSQTAPLRGSSQLIIDHPSSTHLLRSSQDERMSTRTGNDKGCLQPLFLSVFPEVWRILIQILYLACHFLSCYRSWSAVHCFSIYFFPLSTCFFQSFGFSKDWKKPITVDHLLIKSK